jgi:hypothetical protein
MKRLVLQYAGLAANLAAMFWAVAYLRRDAEAVYLSQMAIFLILLAWSTPFEASFGNGLISAAKNQPGAIRWLLHGNFNQSAILKAAVIGCCFAAAFLVYARSGDQATLLAATGIGLIFFARLLEYLLRAKLLFKKLGQESNILTNFFTAAKWVTAALFVMGGLHSFSLFLAAHLGFALVSIGVLSALFLRRRFDDAAGSGADVGSSLKSDAVAIAGMALGIFAFQIDKLAAGLVYDAPHFAEYVAAYTLAFIGPYIINPIITLALQRLAIAEISATAGIEDIRSKLAALIRSGAMVINIAIPTIVTIFLSIASRPVSAETQQLIAFVTLSSYLNCLAHAYYVDYLARGDLKAILLQNLTATVIAGITMSALLLLGLRDYGIVLVAAGFGQVMFGMAKSDQKVDGLLLFSILFMALYLTAYARAFPFASFDSYFIPAAMLISLLTFYLELKKSHLSVRGAFAMLRT